MTKEDKELLLKDLSARLLHRVYISPVDCGKAILIGIKDGNPLLWDTIHRKEYDKPWDIGYIKPYLRQMSSITEEEKEELSHLLPKYWSVEIDKLNNFYFDMSPSIFMEIDVFLNIIDWLNAHHFDYRGLIERGLALKAPEGMYEKEK